MIASGVSDRIIKEILGHKSIVTTMDIYAHVDIHTQRRGTRAISTLLGFEPQHDNIEADQPET